MGEYHIQFPPINLTRIDAHSVRELVLVERIIFQTIATGGGNLELATIERGREIMAFASTLPSQEEQDRFIDLYSAETHDLADQIERDWPRVAGRAAPPPVGPTSNGRWWMLLIVLFIGLTLYAASRS